MRILLAIIIVGVLLTTYAMIEIRINKRPCPECGFRVSIDGPDEDCPRCGAMIPGRESDVV
jgi:hypothetical protein